MIDKGTIENRSRLFLALGWCKSVPKSTLLLGNRVQLGNNRVLHVKKREGRRGLWSDHPFLYVVFKWEEAEVDEGYFERVLWKWIRSESESRETLIVLKETSSTIRNVSAMMFNSARSQRIYISHILGKLIFNYIVVIFVPDILSC